MPINFLSQTNNKLYQTKRPKEKECLKVVCHPILEDTGDKEELYYDKKQFENYKCQKDLTAIEYVNLKNRITEIPEFDLLEIMKILVN